MSIGITQERVHRKDMVVDLRVQRPLDPRRVAKIAREGFDPAALGTVTLSRRMNGDLAIINGQHRMELAVAEGYQDKFYCQVHHGLTLSEEAALFLRLNNQKTPSALTNFLVRITEGDKVAQDINDIAEAHGWHIEQSSHEGCIAAVEALERCYRTAANTRPDGTYADVLDHVLTVTTRAWGHSFNGVHQSMLQGLAQLYGRYDGGIDSGKLITDLQKHSPVELLGKAKLIQSAQGGTVPAAMAKVLVGIHNNRKRTNLLPEWVWTR